MASVLFAGGAAAQEAALPTIDVQGDTGSGYQAPANSGVTRIPTPLRDTPQTVNVITRQLATEQGARTMEDALRNVTGITFSAGEGGQQGDSPFIRGFTARGDIFRDGIRDPGWYTRDFFSIQNVEVYKGPSSFAFGRGSTGGAINNVSRIAEGATFAEGTVTGSMPFGIRTELDVSGKANPNTSMRVQALYQDVNTPDRDSVWTKRWGVAPSAVFQLNDQTKMTASYIYQGEESVPDYGVPYYPSPTRSPTTGLTTGGYNGNGTAVAPVNVPRNTFLGFNSGPFADVVNTDAHIATLKFDHDINAGTRLSNVTRYMAVDRFARPTAPRSLGLSGQLTGGATTPPPGYPTDLMTVGLQHWQNITDNTILINQTDLVSKFETGTLKHTLAMGLELSQETRHQQRANLCYPATGGSTPAGAPICRTPLVNPNIVGTSQFTGWGNPQDTDMTNIGAYISDQIKLNRWFEIMGSARFDQLDSDYTDMTQALPANRSLHSSDGMFSWRLGAVFHPTENSSLYYATGVSFNPSSELGTLANNTVSLEPEKTESQEIGAKADVLNGRLSLNAAWFHIEKTNMRVADPTMPTAQILGGIAVSEGFEFGLAGKITDKWSMFAGYTVMDSALTGNVDLSQYGRRLPNAPPQSFTLWTTYELTSKWTIGGGTTYNSDTYANAQNTVYVPEYWKFDAMATYKIDDRSLLQFNIYNITDELYYAQYYGGQAVPAPGRSASLSYKIRF